MNTQGRKVPSQPSLYAQGAAKLLLRLDMPVLFSSGLFERNCKNRNVHFGCQVHMALHCNAHGILLRTHMAYIFRLPLRKFRWPHGSGQQQRW